MIIKKQFRYGRDRRNKAGIENLLDQEFGNLGETWKYFVTKRLLGAIL